MYQHSQCQINIFILIIKRSFIKYIFGIVDIDIFSINLVKNFANFDLTQILRGVRTRGSIMHAEQAKKLLIYSRSKSQRARPHEGGEGRGRRDG